MLLLGLSGTFAFQATLSFGRSVHVLRLHATQPGHDNHQSRRSLLQKTATVAATITAATLPVPQASAAPPIAIIAEELGYFPVTNRAGETVYVAARVKRKSSEQSIKLAQHLKSVSKMRPFPSGVHIEYDAFLVLDERLILCSESILSSFNPLTSILFPCPLHNYKDWSSHVWCILVSTLLTPKRIVWK